MVPLRKPDEGQDDPNILEDETGMLWLSQLLQYTERDLLSIQNINRKTISKIALQAGKAVESIQRNGYFVPLMAEEEIG